MTTGQVAGIAGVELVVIGADTNIEDFKTELRNDTVRYHLNRGL